MHPTTEYRCNCFLLSTTKFTITWLLVELTLNYRLQVFHETLHYLKYLIENKRDGQLFVIVSCHISMTRMSIWIFSEYKIYLVRTFSIQSPIINYFFTLYDVIFSVTANDYVLTILVNVKLSYLFDQFSFPTKCLLAHLKDDVIFFYHHKCKYLRMFLPSRLG
jgi:hypothetical protein